MINTARQVEILKMNIEANMLRIEELMKIEGVFHKTRKDSWGIMPNRNNIELRQRMKLLRKDTLKMEELMKELSF